MMSTYIIAFSRESFPALVFISILSLHPIVAIPIGIFADCVQAKAHQLLDSCFNPQRAINIFLKRFFTFTMITYLGCLTFLQWYLFLIWIEKREVLIRNGFGSIGTFNDVKQELFNQCPCLDDNCQYIMDSSKNLITNFLSMYVFQYEKAWILLGSSGFFFVFHFIECLMVSEPYSKPLLNFLTGKPVDDVNDTKDENRYEIEMKEVSQSQQNSSLIDTSQIPNQDDLCEEEETENARRNINLPVVDLYLAREESLVPSAKRQSVEVSDDQKSLEHDENQSKEQKTSNSLESIEHQQTAQTIVGKKRSKCFKVFANILAIIYIGCVVCCPLTFDFAMDYELRKIGNSKSFLKVTLLLCLSSIFKCNLQILGHAIPVFHLNVLSLFAISINHILDA